MCFYRLQTLNAFVKSVQITKPPNMAQNIYFEFVFDCIIFRCMRRTVSVFASIPSFTFVSSVIIDSSILSPCSNTC